MKILAIETSHDDTSLAFFDDGKIIKEKIISQIDFHQQFGGTLPEYASRLHERNLTIILDEFLKLFDFNELDHIAVTTEPGLIGSLHMGRLFAHALGFAFNKPVKYINHMHAHIFATCFNHEISFPSLALVVSGGHTQFWHVESPKKIKLLGQTKDDAVGEVFDKVARELGLSLPGGPSIEKIALTTNEKIDFNLQHNDKSLDFSFSGLKTKVINYIHNFKKNGEILPVAKIAKGFQESIINNLIFKTKIAIEFVNPNSIILGGGVSANDLLRQEFYKLHSKVLIPEKKYTTDNASMIAMMSYVLSKNDKTEL